MKKTLKSLFWGTVWMTAAVSHANAQTMTVGVPGPAYTAEDPYTNWASASMTLLGGTATLAFNNATGADGGVSEGAVGGVVGALNTGQVQLFGLDGATVTQSVVYVDGDDTRGMSQLQTHVSKLLKDPRTGELTNVWTDGSAQFVANHVPGGVNGGEINVSNIRYLPGNRVTIMADVSMTPLVNDNGVWSPGATTIEKDVWLWSASTITGATTLAPPAVYAAGAGDFSQLDALGFTQTAKGDGTQFTYVFEGKTILGGLKITEWGFDMFANALGYQPGSAAYVALGNANNLPDGWGSLTSRISFSVVPEPGTWALMALGLVGLAAAARRQKFCTTVDK